MYESIEIWLLSTVPGVILLGALGGILSIYLIKFSKALIEKWIPGLFGAWNKYQSKRLIPYGWVLGRFSGDSDASTLVCFFSYHLMKFIALLFASGLSFILFAVLFFVSNNQLLTSGAYMALVLCIVAVYFAFDHLRIVNVMYSSEIVPKLQKMKEAFKSLG